MGRQPTLRRDVDLRRWATIPVESGNGIDPAITGEPSEERPVRPSRTERVGPSQPQVERPRIGVASGVVPRRSRTGVASSPSLDCRHAVPNGAGAWGDDAQSDR